MSEEEDTNKDKKPEDSEPKEAPKKEKKSISIISQQLDDLSYSLGMIFPTFGISSSKVNNNNRHNEGISSSGYNRPPYQSSYTYSRTNNGPNAPPRDLISKVDREQVIENELQMDGKMRPIVSPKTNSSQIAPSRTGLNTSGVRNDDRSIDRREFGTQTTDRLYSKPLDSFSRRSPTEKKRVEFPQTSIQNRDGQHNNNNGQSKYDISHSNMKQFTKNVQDLYRRKQKAGSILFILVYGEDEFKISNKVDSMN